MGPERAAELAFAALDADGDGWICAEDLVRASDAGDGERDGGEGGGGEEEREAKKATSKKAAPATTSSLAMSREEALACIAEARRHCRRDEDSDSDSGGDEGEGDRIDLEGFKRVIWSSSRR